MTAELTVLALAGLLQGVQFLLVAVPANMQIGPDYMASPRDTDPPRELSRTAGRLRRAFLNHFEALILFTLAVVVVTMAGQSTGFTAGCAWIYLIARVLYVPAYVFGWVPWRSAIWAVGFATTMLMILASLF
ncbi:MAPEG family protein [Paracoccus tegillarcae]|uniref:MAPEG family protein n=1 Tax=Paracoccus tegillarcae TaxID=1529068 RepID=A0A2K9EPZ5_9RHOB|nr:MAPEG family protein [Paracoccus tegillarcae]AUH35557.1 hypothetical protein CUV01_17785 [Paracoccus tegillarcae]